MIVAGPWGAARAVRDLLDARIDDALRSVEVDDPDLDAGKLRGPQLVAASDPGDVGLDQMPALLVGARTGSVSTLDDVSSTSGTWQTSYSLQVEVIVQGSTVTEADTNRYSYLLAVRRVLLAHPGGDGWRILPRLQEAYDDAREGQQGWAAQAMVVFDVEVAETVDRGTVVGRLVEPVLDEVRSVPSTDPLPWPFEQPDDTPAVIAPIR